MVLIRSPRAVSRDARLSAARLLASAQRRAGRAQAGKPTDNDAWLTLAIGAALAFVLLLGKGFFVAILAPALSILAAWFASRWIAARIGGYTGDTLGAVQQKAEIAFLVVAALLFISH